MKSNKDPLVQDVHYTKHSYLVMFGSTVYTSRSPLDRIIARREAWHKLLLKFGGISFLSKLTAERRDASICNILFYILHLQFFA